MTVSSTHPRTKGFWSALAVAFAIVGGLVGAYAALIGLPALSVLSSQQDGCSFGLISNQRYQELLSRARSAAARDGDDLTSIVQERSPLMSFGRTIENQVDELTAGISSIQERVAAIHAVLRANRAEYIGVWPNTDDPFAEVARQAASRTKLSFGIQGKWAVALQYRFNLVWFGDWKPLGRWGYTSARFYLADSESDMNRVTETHARNTVEITTFLPVFPKGLSDANNGPAGCPPVPDASWEQEFLGG